MKQFISKLRPPVFFSYLFVVCLLLQANWVDGQVVSIWTNPITGTNPGASNPYTTGDVKNANLVVSGIGFGNGINSSNGNNYFNTNGWTTNNAISVNDYFNFTITPNTGYKVSFSSFTYTATLGGRAPTNFAFRTDANGDNFTNSIGTPNATGTTISLTTSDISTATRFRLFGWNAPNGGGNNWGINNFTFSGTVLGSATTSFTGLNYVYGAGPSTAKSFVVNGVGLTSSTATVTVTGSTNYEVSTTSSSTGFGATASLNASAGSISSASVWVRLKEGLSVGNYNNEIISFGGGGVTGINISCSGTVSTKALTVTASGPGKIYGTALAAGASSTNFTASGMLAGEVVSSVTLTPNAAGISATTAAGVSYTVTPAAPTGTGGFLASNYSISYVAYNGTVSAKPLTISAPSIASKVYDRNLSTGLVTGGSLSGLVGTQTVTCTATGLYADVNVGTGKTATVTYTLSNGLNGGLASNYILDAGTGTGNITAMPVNLTPNAGQGKAYGNSDPVLSYSSSPALFSPDVFTGSINRSVGEAIGSYAYALGSLTAGGNYSLSLGGSNTFSINSQAVAGADFRSKASGNFNNPSIWEYDQGGGDWANASTFPVGSNNITVRSGDSVCLNVDHAVAANKTFLLNGGAKLSIGANSILSAAANATIHFNAQAVTVISNALGTGSIGKIAGTLSGATNVTVERYIGNNKRSWRLLTIPVSGPTIRQAWAGANANGNAPSGETAGVGTLITGHGATYSNPSSAIASGFDFWPGLGGSTTSSIRHYNNASWASATNTPDVKSVPSQQGYMLYVRGDRTVTSGEGTTTLRATGSLKTGAQTIAINQPYTVVGNPFASAINIKNMYSHGTNSSAITNNFWVWDSRLGTSGAYRLISAGGDGSFTSTPAGVADSFLIINSGQAFFVQRNGSNPTSIVIDENDKDTASHAAHLLRPTTPGVESSLAISLYQAKASEIGNLCDGVVARFGDNYNSLPTEPYDVYKLNNFNENISLVRNSRYLGIESRPYPVSSDTLFLPFWGQAIREYALQINNNQFLDSGLTAKLIDRFAKTETPLSSSNAATTYPFTVTSDTASSSLGRFMIVIHSAPVLAVVFNSISASKKETKVQLDWNTSNENSVESYDIEKSADGILFAKVDTARAFSGMTSATHQWLDERPYGGTNYYRVRSNDKNGRHQLSAIASVKLLVDNAYKIQVSPTVIDNRRFNIVLNQPSPGAYTLLLTNAMGQLVFRKTVSHSGGNCSIPIDLGGSNIASGMYLLSVEEAAGKKEFFRLLITQ